ncbi:MAG TPA: EthD family reductase [Pseudolabrys sp.]
MVKLTLLYGQPKSPEAFEKYYAETHMPLASKMQGVRRVELSKVTGTVDGSAPAFYRIADLYFDDLEHMNRVMSMPEGKAAVADLPNFATGGVTTLVSTVS